MTYRPDHRRVLDNLDLGWPAETITQAQAEYDAELRRQPDDPGIPVHAVGDSEAWDDFDRHVLRAPVRSIDTIGPRRIVALFTLAAGMALGAGVVAILAWSWGL